MGTFDQILRRLDIYERETLDALGKGLAEGMQLMEQTAQASPAYRNVTGATRGGTVGYAVGVNDGRFQRAVAVVEGRNPGAAHVESLPSGGPDTLTGILTVPTDYIDEIEKRGSVLESALVQDARLVTQVVANEVRAVR